MRYFLGRKKGTARPIKTVLGTSQVLWLLSFWLWRFKAWKA